MRVSLYPSSVCSAFTQMISSRSFFFSFFLFFRLPRSATTVFSARLDSPMSSRGHVSQLASAGIMVYSWWFAARATANLHAACDGATSLILVPCDRRGNLYGGEGVHAWDRGCYAVLFFFFFFVFRFGDELKKYRGRKYLDIISFNSLYKKKEILGVFLFIWIFFQDDI